MLTAIHLENFRTWVGRHEIPLRPFTLLYGPNSAGKSSIFHAVNVLRQSLLSAHGPVVSLASKGEVATVGDFKNLVSFHDTKVPIVIGVTWEEGAASDPFLGIQDGRRGVRAEFRYLEGSQGSGVLTQLTLEVGNHQFAFSLDPQGRGYVAELPSARICNAIADRLPELKGRTTRGVIRELVKYFSPFQFFEFSDGIPLRAGRRAAIDPSMLLDWLRKRRDHPALRQLRLDWASIEAHLAPTSDDDLPAVLGGTTKRFIGAIQEGFDTHTSHGIHRIWTGALASFSHEMREALSRVRHLGPVRVVPDRIEARSKAPRLDDVGSRGEWVVQVLAEPTVLRTVQDLAREMGEDNFPYRIDVVQSDVPSREHGAADKDVRGIDVGLSLLMNDLRFANCVVTAADVGYGISQLLPILAQVVAAPTDSVVLIEQPEIHLHPRLQVQIAQVLWDAARGRNARPVQIVCETHSEVVIHRVTRLFRHSSAAEREVVARDTAVLYVLGNAGRVVDGTLRKCVVQDVFMPGDSEEHAPMPDPVEDPIGHANYVLEHWPEGFFSEGLDEMLAVDLPQRGGNIEES